MLTLIQQLSSCLDSMIRQKTNDKQLSLFEVFKNSDSWFNELSKLRKLYKSLSDPDALALAPEMAKTFDAKTTLVKTEFGYDPALVEKLLIELSLRRKELGFDERSRKIKRNPFDPEKTR